jgi:hypothetical protein
MIQSCRRNLFGDEIRYALVKEFIADFQRIIGRKNRNGDMVQSFGFQGLDQIKTIAIFKIQGSENIVDLSGFDYFQGILDPATGNIAKAKPSRNFADQLQQSAAHF